MKFEINAAGDWGDLLQKYPALEKYHGRHEQVFSKYWGKMTRKLFIELDNIEELLDLTKSLKFSVLVHDNKTITIYDDYLD